MSVTLVHDFHTKTSSVQNVSPGVHNSTLTLNNGLIEVESVEIEAMVETPSCEPNADDSWLRGRSGDFWSC